MSEFVLLVSSFVASVTLYVQVRFYKKNFSCVRTTPNVLTITG